MTIAWYREHQMEIPSKLIFLDEETSDYTLVESFYYDGVYFLIESHVDAHKEEVKWEELHGFFTKEDANDYFVNVIKKNNVHKYEERS